MAKRRKGKAKPKNKQSPVPAIKAHSLPAIVPTDQQKWHLRRAIPFIISLGGQVILQISGYQNPLLAFVLAIIMIAFGVCWILTESRFIQFYRRQSRMISFTIFLLGGLVIGASLGVFGWALYKPKEPRPPLLPESHMLPPMPTAEEIANEVVNRLPQSRPASQSNNGSKKKVPAAAEANTVVSLGLFPGLVEGSTTDAKVTGLALAFQNNGTATDHNVSTKLFYASPAADVKVDHPDRVRITDGGVGGNFVNLFIPELSPGELQVVSIGLAVPIEGYRDADSFGNDQLRSPEFWSDSQGKSKIIVYRTTMGPERRLGEK